MSEPIVIVGRSGRAAAVSARRAGYEPWVIDCISARDTQRIAHSLKVDPRDYPHKLPELVQKAPASAPIMMTGDLENHPTVWEAITFGREIIGSNADAIKAVRQIDVLNEDGLKKIKIKGIKACRTRTIDDFWSRVTLSVFGVWDRRKYIVKPRRGSGGEGIRHWDTTGSFKHGSPGTLDRTEYLQQYIQGIPIGTVFRADGWSVQFLGASEMIVGDWDFGADLFNYVGSIGEIDLQEKSRAAISQVAVALTQRHDLRGIFGIDWIMDYAGRLWPIEVNPRYTASVEVLERCKGAPMMNSPTSKTSKPTQNGLMSGKASVRAKKPGMIDADFFDVFGEHFVANVPKPGAPIRKGEHICTIFAEGQTRDEVHKNLREKAAQVYAKLK
ncbi:ATP-grasp domain-containing protein [Poriferisphaera sp. WC338]|uniref:ATP-grasp domain-containing protein n=1 Tax=Poriferisphaera sp. WC338 TaxID=3425129 RepID=UPI003D81332B